MTAVANTTEYRQACTNLYSNDWSEERKEFEEIKNVNNRRV